MGSLIVTFYPTQLYAEVKHFPFRIASNRIRSEINWKKIKTQTLGKSDHSKSVRATSNIINYPSE